MKILHLGKAGNVEKYTPDKELLEKIELVDLPMSTPIGEVVEKAGDAEIIIADAIGKVPGELIRQMPHLKMIHSEGVAYNSFDIEAAREQHVYVCNCKGMNAMAVAEQNILLMLGILRDVIPGDASVRKGDQITRKENYMKQGNLYELADCTVGLIGFGDIARCVAQVLRAFGVKTYYYARHQVSADVEEQYHVSYCQTLDELCKYCNMFSVHIPVTQETTHLLNDDFFSKVMPGSYLINTARGEVVDSEALIRAIANGTIAQAGIDTLEHEPVQTDNVLVAQPREISDRILFSPHIGGITQSSFHRGYQMVWDDILKIQAGQKPGHVVNDWT